VPSTLGLLCKKREPTRGLEKKREHLSPEKTFSEIQDLRR